MAVILFGLAEEILKNLGSRALKEIASAWGFKDHYEQLRDTISIVRNVLLDAEEKQAESRAVQDWLEKLTTVVYAADDLFDEFNTIASRKQLLEGNEVAKKVKTFFSASNKIAYAFTIPRRIKDINEKLESLIKLGSGLGLSPSSLEQGRVTAGKRRDQTISYVDADEVIGRDVDKKVVLDFLFTSTFTNDEDEVLSVLPIVGMGGMGKTTLAQFVYNDPLVKDYFELKLWACVAEDFDIKVITEKILKSITNSESPNVEMEQLQNQLRKEIRGKKYLLVLDDVWEENPNKWGDLRVLLKTGKKGSKILVTTRSEKVVKIMGTYPAHKLQGLSEEKSWDLFEKMAYKTKEVQEKPHLVYLGKQIVKKCANVPLAIVTLGRLCRCEDESKWLSFKDKNLSDVMCILKLSYQHLSYLLKHCFSFCALFPKDYRLQKEMLIDLWMAEGFVITGANEGHSLKNIAEEYFLDLLQRGFFQDVVKNEWGDILSCKMHDLMHDLALDEAKAMCKVATSSHISFEDKILHLSFAESLPLSWEIPNDILKLKLLRTFLLPWQFDYGSSFNKSICHKLVTKFRFLRVLDLNRLGFKSLPRSIGKLIHLRYLNLSHAPIESLPNSITNLHNLQILNLYCCNLLTTLPSSIQKLANLRSLDVRECSSLTHMPSGIRGLMLLHELPVLIVGHKQSAKLRKKPTSTAKLSDLNKLNNLEGVLKIHIHGRSGNNMLEAREADIIRKDGLTKLKIIFDKTSFEGDMMNHDEAVLEALKPHGNLRVLRISGYGGQKLPSWAMADNLAKILPNLVKVCFEGWINCQQVPRFSQLSCLKRLHIIDMEKVEYMESGVFYALPSSSSNLFFPSLEELRLYNMENLKGWWKELSIIGNDDTIVGESTQQQCHNLSSMQFPKLSHLGLFKCPNLTFLPQCPNVTDLHLFGTNKDLLSQLKMMTPISNPSSSSTSGWSGLKLKKLEIEDAENLKSVSQVGLGQLSSLSLHDEKLQSMEELAEIFATLSSSLRNLWIFCQSLRSISKGLEHLTGLELLHLGDCEELELSANEQIIEDESEDADVKISMPWQAFKTSLRILKLEGMPRLVSLPSQIQHLTNLQELYIIDMEELREIPEWISCLTSLEVLDLINCPKLTSLPQGIQQLTSMYALIIVGCQGLTKRCQRPNGSERPKIQHIPFVFARDSF